MVGLELGLVLNRLPAPPVGEYGGTEKVVTAKLLRRAPRRAGVLELVIGCISGRVEGRREVGLFKNYR